MWCIQRYSYPTHLSRGLFWDTSKPTVVIHLILTTLVFISCKILTFDESHSKHRIAETEGRNIEAVMNKLTAPCNIHTLL